MALNCAKKILDSIPLHLHLCWSEGEPQAGTERLWVCPCPCPGTQGGRLQAAGSVPCVSHTPCWHTGCCLGNATEQPGCLGTFPLHCPAPSSISQTTTKKATKRGKKPSQNELCVPSLATPTALAAHRSQAELVSAGCYSLHNFMVIWGSLHDGVVKAQGGSQGLAFIPSSAPSPVCFGMTYFGCPIGTNLVLSICCLCYFQGFLRLKSKQ